MVKGESNGEHIGDHHPKMVENSLWNILADVQRLCASNQTGKKSKRGPNQSPNRPSASLNVGYSQPKICISYNINISSLTLNKPIWGWFPLWKPWFQWGQNNSGSTGRHFAQWLFQQSAGQFLSGSAQHSIDLKQRSADHYIDNYSPKFWLWKKNMGFNRIYIIGFNGI